ncbi:MAG: hypothetical protein IKU23_04045 [Clostridia bacterium]|nr:hypothetical protein [Clostridia bacterium]
MTIQFGNRTVSSTDISDFETAWMIEDALLVLEYLKSRNRIVLGGDILTEKLEHNYDSWYYNAECNQSLRFNVECSIKVAIEYISNYIQANGTDFYVIFVVDN